MFRLGILASGGRRGGYRDIGGRAVSLDVGLALVEVIAHPLDGDSSTEDGAALGLSRLVGGHFNDAGASVDVAVLVGDLLVGHPLGVGRVGVDRDNAVGIGLLTEAELS
mgnify:CR=1 FL=1